MEPSFFPSQSGAPQMSSYIVTSPQQRKAAGVTQAYAEDYNNAQMQAFNNDYNYFLWQQQAHFNTPLEQVKRLKEAGLNPNYNAIEGAGNLKDTPASRGDLHSSATRNELAQTNLYLNGINSILAAVKDGVNMTSQLAAIPSDIGLYRQYLTRNIRNTVDGKRLDNYLKEIQAASEAWDKLGIETEYINQPPGVGYDARTNYYHGRELSDSVSHAGVFLADSPHFRNKELDIQYQSFMNDATSLLKDLRQGQVDINDQQLKNLKETYRILTADADFRKWMNGASVGAGIARIVGAFL